MHKTTSYLLPSSLPVSAIVPAHNEGGLISNVLQVLLQEDSLSEIIVVDDGSIDDTLEKSCHFAQIDPRVRVLKHEVNEGKGQAVITGWRAAHTPILLFLDADLVGLNVEHVRSLIRPVLEDRVDMSVGLFRGGQLFTDLAHMVTPWLSGQRCLKANLLESVSMKAGAGYGIETAITITAKNERWRCCNVYMTGVTHPPSEFHRGIWAGIRTRGRMYGEILRAWWILGRQKPPRFPASSKSSLMLIFFLYLSTLSQVFYSLKALIRSGLNHLLPESLEKFQRILVYMLHLDQFLLFKNTCRHPKVSENLVVTSTDSWSPFYQLYMHSSPFTFPNLSCLPDFMCSLVRLVSIFTDNAFHEILHLNNIISTLSHL
jgi:glycosyltransferase involved in cell wall biosynthesis